MNGLTRSGFALLAVALASCDAPSPEPGAAEPAPAAAAVDLGDPTTQAIMGSAERALHVRHPGASLVFADQALSTTTADQTVCGRYVVVKRHWQGRRYFIASATALEVVANGSARWKKVCDGAKPVPSALVGPAADAAVTAAAASAES